jgi:allophanate hydrolase subunit 1
VQCLLATSNFDKSKVEMYPNPFENEIFVENHENTSIKIYDSLGRLVLESENQKTIKTQDLVSGIYNLLIEKDKKTISKRMIKK